MPQLSLYIDEKTLKEVEKAASQQHISMSKWVVQRIKSQLKPSYPENYGSLFGSLSEDPIQRAPQIPFDVDAKREEL